MKKYLVLLVVLISCGFVEAANPLILSSLPAENSFVSNSDVIVLTFNEPIIANLSASNYTITASNSAYTVYCRNGHFYESATLANISPYVFIDPLHTNQLTIKLTPYTILPGTDIIFTFNFRSIYSIATPTKAIATVTKTYKGIPPSLISLYPSHIQDNVLPNDSISLIYSSAVDYSQRGDLFFSIYDAGDNLFWETTGDDPLVNIYINSNSVQFSGLPVFVPGTTYKVIVDNDFFKPSIPGFVDGEWTFSVNEITAIPPNTPVVASTTASISNDFSITFSDNIVVNSGYVYIKDYSDNSLVEQINVSSCSVVGATLTIPHAALNGATHYYIEMSKGIVMSSTTGYRFRGMNGNSTWHFTTENVNIWKGEISDDFLNGGNWSNGGYDDTQATIIGASSYPAKISTALAATDLTISSTGKLEITSSGSLTMSGKLTMESTSTSNSSLIVNGSLSVSPTNVYIYQFAGNTGGTLKKGYSSPVSGATGTSAGTTQTILKFDNPTAKYVTVPAATTWDAAVGYATYASTPLVFKGALNTAATYSMPLIYTSDPGGGAIYSSPYNFYGNPYTAPLDWEKMWKALTPSDTMLVRQTCWVLKESGSWKTINGKTRAVTGGAGTAIPRGHAFMLRAKPPVGGGDASNTIVFKKAHLAEGNQTFLKSLPNEVAPTNVRLTAISDKFQSDILYCFHPEAQFYYENYDSEYQTFPSTSASFDDRLQIATYNNVGSSIALAINTVPEFVDSTSFNIAYYVKKEGVYCIELTELDEIFKTPNTTVTLRDTVSNELVTMAEGDKYYFYTTSTPSVVKNRFKITIKGYENVVTTITQPLAKKSKASVFYSPSIIHINIYIR